MANVENIRVLDVGASNCDPRALERREFRIANLTRSDQSEA